MSKFLRKGLLSLVAICLFLAKSTQAGTIYINEVLSSNVSIYQNSDYSEYVDIVEIYNTGSTVSLNGYYLTDDRNNPTKWMIQSATITGGGYKLFYADERNTGSHTNFKLSIKGEFIGLYDSKGNVVDSFSYGKQRNDISFGRNASNMQTFAYFQTPTIGKTNGNSLYTTITSNPQFTIPGGFFNTSQIVSFTQQTTVDIYYTIDGSTPTTSSKKYSSPFKIDTTTCVRAIAIKTGCLPSDVETHSFFINTPRNLPTLSIVTDPKNFFDDYEGIYVIGKNGIVAGCSKVPMNVNQDWERPVNLEYYDKSGIVHINQMAGAKIFGGCSRQRYPIKSLAFFSREEYGKTSFDYPFFNTRKYKSYDGILLRSGSDDQNITSFRDAVSQLICDDLEIETQAYQPVAVYINGQYWGIQNLREKYNEDYFKNHYGVSATNLNIVERNSYDTWSVSTGTADSYNQMLDYIKANGLTSISNYNYVASKMDIESYLDHQVALIYMAMDDWPGNNIRYWSANTGQYSKWRWACWDLDHTLKNVSGNWSWNGNKAQNTLELAAFLENQSVTWPNPQWSTFLFRNLLTNTSFKNEFIQSMAYQMNTTFDSLRVRHIIDSIAGNIAPEIPRHIARWGGKTVPNPEPWIVPIFETVDKWKENVQVYRDFAKYRPDTMINIIKKFFKLSGTVNLTFSKSDNDAGYIKFYRKIVKTNTHTGKYYNNVPVLLTAIPAPGYRFVQWEITPIGSSKTINTNAVLSYVPTKNTTLKAVFEATTTSPQSIVINEINYHSSATANSGDWVELYNAGDNTIDISNWKLRDGTEYNYFTLPSNFSLAANEYIVVCEDTVLFKGLFPNAKPRIGQLGYGLSNGGEVIRLYDAGNGFVDSVRYNDKAPWPEAADGLGYTLELRSPELDNTLPASWTFSKSKGTPDAKNSCLTAIDEIRSENSELLSQIYPNPCKGLSTISYKLDKPAQVKLSIKNVFGQEVKTIVDANQQGGNFIVYFDANSIANGVYFYSLMINGTTIETKRMIVEK